MTTYTIEVPDTFDLPADRFNHLFDWIDSGSVDSTDFISDCFSGLVSAKETRIVASAFGIRDEAAFSVVWGTVLACYFGQPISTVIF